MHSQRLPEIVVPGKRLGRHVHHDPRSLSFAFKAPLAPRTVRWSTEADTILDQGNVGSCTGNATVGALSCTLGPLYAGLTPQQKSTLTESLALRFYTRATQTDPFDGEYPAEDTGSDGNDVAKAATQYGYISGWAHALSLNDALSALSLGPFIFGQNWYEGMDDPDSTGLVKVTGSVRGGHETCYDEIDLANKRLGFRNSWSRDFGVNGRAYISFADFERLLHEDGDVTVLTPLTAPAPTPTPPTPAYLDKALADATRAWSAAPHTKTNKQAANAVVTWRNAKGL